MEGERGTKRRGDWGIVTVCEVSHTCMYWGIDRRKDMDAWIEMYWYTEVGTLGELWKKNSEREV